jgi:hypothetical protein
MELIDGNDDLEQGEARWAETERRLIEVALAVDGREPS